MAGRTSVITGAASGIGRELCHIIHGLGGAVVALDRNETGLELLRQHLGERVYCIPTRHEDLSSVANAANIIAKKYNSIDLLINNAGMSYNSEKHLPGSSAMKSSHGKDLAFTVNYLSHFLLVEKLSPNLRRSEYGRIVHLTSSYHWKVDGSELIPRRILSDGVWKEEPLAYQSDPEVMSERHLRRSYANTKLAQIWHSRYITGVESVCACVSCAFSRELCCSIDDIMFSWITTPSQPTWVATGIAGESNRSFLQNFAFPVEGAGIASALNAIFRPKTDLVDALNNGQSFVANSRILEYIPFKNTWSSHWLREYRDDIVDLGGLILLLGQRFTYGDFIVQRTSEESCDVVGRKAFYEWSLKEIHPWL